MKFESRTALITGAAKGIGKAIAINMAKNGVDLILTDILMDELSRTAEEAAAFGVRVKAVSMNVANETEVRSVIKDGIKEFGRIDILVNNAGIYPGGNFVASTSDEWKRTIDINILGTMYPTHAVLPHMIENGYGRIVNIASVAGVYGISYFVEYSMSKGAIISFTKALAKLVSDKGITVNCVSPGSIDVTGGNNPMLEHSFIGRAGTPDELASAVLFVASDNASYISGQNYLVDGCRKKM